MKQPIRAFAIGLLTSGVIMLIGFFFWGTTSANDEMSTEEMIPLVKEEGYHVLSQEEYISLSVEKDKKRKENKKEQATEEKKDKKENKKDEATDEKASEEASDKPEKYKINIKPGMATSEISNLLEEKKIIKDSGKFDQYLEKENYSEKVQIGEFEVTSDMSFYELAEKIAR